MNQSPLKKILKIFLALALIGVTVFLGIKFLFPAPNRYDAYNKTFALSQNESAEKFLNTTDNFILLMAERVTDETLNQKTYNMLMISQVNLIALGQANEFIMKELAFAKNNSVYDSNAKNINNLYDDIVAEYATIDSYIEQNIKAFMLMDVKTTQSINSYAFAILNFQLKLNNLYVQYNIAASNIYKNLDKNFTNNVWMQELLSITTAWTSHLNELLQNNQNDTQVFVSNQQNAAGFGAFVTNNLIVERAQQYYTNENTASLLTDMKNNNLTEVVKNVFTQNEQTYIDAIADAAKKASAERVFNFVKGVE